MRSIRKSSKSLVTSDFSSLQGLEDLSTIEVLENVSKKLNCENLHEKWFEVLKENLFDEKVSSLDEVTAEDWTAMNLPLRVYVELRKLLREKKKDFEITKKSPRVSSEDLRLINNKEISIGVSQQERRRKTHKKNLSQSEPRQFFLIQNNNNIREISINIVGEETISTLFRKTSAQLFSRNLQADMENYGIIHAYDDKVKLQFFSCPEDAENNCSLILFLFSVTQPHTLEYLHSSFQKHLPTFHDKKIIEIPLLLIGIDTSERENFRKQNKKIITSVAGERAASDFNALQYMELTSLKDLDQFDIIVHNIARMGVRYVSLEENVKYSAILSEVQKNLETQNIELALKKKSLKYSPTFITYLHHLQRLKLSNNLIKYFPKELKNLPNLVELDLSYNLIDEISVENLLNFPSLIKLDLEYNKLENLPLDEFKRFKKLQELKMKGNPLSSLPSRFRKKSNLLDMKSIPPKKLAVFGVRLEAKLEEDRYYFPHLLIPYFADVAINWLILHGLCKEGLFRLPGKGNSINKLRDSFAFSSDVKIPKETDPTIVTSLLKQYFRELPEPVLTFDRFNDIVSTVNLNNSEQLSKLIEIIRTLPIEYYYLTRSIFKLIHLVSIHAEFNLMNISNVCKMLAPNLLRQPASKEIDISLISCTNTAIESIADNYEKIFEAPEMNIFEDGIGNKEKGLVFHRKLQFHKHPISCMTFTDDQKYIWTADVTGNCFIWNSDTMEILEKVEATNKKIIVLCAVLDCMWIGTATGVQIRDAKTGKFIKDVDGEAFFHSIIKVNVDIWMSRGTSITILNKTGEIKKEFPTNLITALCKVSDNQVWTSTSDHKIQAWNINTLELVEEFSSTHERKINEIKVMSNTEIWTMGDDAVICTWDIRNFTRISRLANFHTSKVFGACKVGNHSWSFSWDPEIHIWDIDSNGHVETLSSFHNDAITQVISKWNAKFDCWEVISSSFDKSLVIWQVRNNPKQEKHKSLINRAFWNTKEFIQVGKTKSEGSKTHLNLSEILNSGNDDEDFLVTSPEASRTSSIDPDCTISPKTSFQSRLKLDLNNVAEGSKKFLMRNSSAGSPSSKEKNNNEEVRVVNPLLAMRSSNPSN